MRPGDHSIRPAARRWAGAAAAALALSGGLVACGQSSEEPTLTVWVDETRYAALSGLVGEYSKASGIKIALQQKNFDDIRGDFATQVAAGQGPDVTVGANDWMGEFIANNLVAPVDLSGVADQFDERTIKAYTSGGNTYAVPYAMENLGLVRNNALIKETKANTFDGLVAEAKAVGTKSTVMMQVGTDGDAYTAYAIQSSFGASVFKQAEDSQWLPELAMADDKGRRFAAYLGELGKQGVLSQSVTYDVVKDTFQNGDAPYAITGPWLVADWVAAGMDVTVLPIPPAGDEPARPFMGVPGFYLSAKSPQQVLATRFLVEFIGSKDTQLALFKAGGRLPANLAAAADQAVADDPVMAGFRQAGQDAVVQPALPVMNQVWKPWGKAESDVVGGADPAKTWDSAMKEILNTMEAAP